MNRILFAIILVFGYIAISATPVISQPAVGDKAPEFQLTDVNGKSHKLSDFKGKYVVLEWVNFDCPFVKKHYDTDNMQNLQNKYMEKGVVWLLICSSAPGKQGHFDNDEIKKRLANHKSNPSGYLIDADGKVGKQYGAKTTPDMRIINPKGEIVYLGAIDNISSSSKDDVQKASNYVSTALDALMMNKSVESKTTKPYGCSVKYGN